MRKFAVIYNRISSFNQLSGISLTVQESVCTKFANSNKLIIKNIYKEVHSAYKIIPKSIRTIMKLRNHTIIISSVDRFSRSVEIGTSIIDSLTNNGNRIVFVLDNLSIDKHSDLSTLIALLQKAQDESTQIGNRIKASKKFLENSNLFIGGIVPYGFKLVDRQLIVNKLEEQVILFMKHCRSGESCVKSVTDNLVKLCLDNDLVVSIPLSIIEESKPYPITYTQISKILNNYTILKKEKLWSGYDISRVISIYNKHIERINNRPKPDNITFVRDMIPSILRIGK